MTDEHGFKIELKDLSHDLSQAKNTFGLVTIVAENCTQKFVLILKETYEMSIKYIETVINYDDIN